MNGTAPESLLEVKNLSVYYGDNRVLNAVDLNVFEHGVSALMGPSGCGKSTLLRAINRLHDLYPNTTVEGQILLKEKNETVDLLSDSHPVEWVRSKVGMVFQKPNPFPKSIYENVAYGLRVQTDLREEAIRQRVKTSLKDAGLWEEVEDRLDSSAQSLSGGQQQRLCIARALAPSPHVLLMDEPTSALDPIATQVIEDLIRKLSKDTSIVLVTHSMQQARRIADQVAFLYMGDIVECAESPAIFENPQHSLTKNYVSGAFG